MAKYDLDEQGSLSELADQIEKISEEGGEDLTGGTAPKRPAPPSSSRITTLLLVLLAVVLLVAAAGIVWLAIRPTGTLAQHTVPQVVGKPVDEAKNAVKLVGLRAVVTYDTTSTKPAGTVIGITPGVGKKLQNGATVKLTVAGNGAQKPKPVTPPQDGPKENPQAANSATNQAPVVVKPTTVVGPKKVTVPDVMGMIDTIAVKKLEELGLKVDVVEERKADGHDHVVLAMNPAKDAQVEPGALVQLTVSIRTAEETKPSVVKLIQVKQYTGMAYQEAVADLTRAGLKPVLVYETSKMQPTGYVLKTQPPVNSQLPPGSEVTVVVAK